MDRIEKRIELKAPRAKVWRALSDEKEFGAWFGMRLDGPFVAGRRVVGQLTVAGYEHLKVELWIEEVRPQDRLALRWHPYAIDPRADYSQEPTTLVEFLLEEAAGGTRLTVIESGFERIPEARRAEAFRMNSGGWEAQLGNVKAHVGG